MVQQTKTPVALGETRWQALLWPLLVIAVGAVSIFVSGVVGALVIIIGYIWLVTRSLPVALAIYVVFSPFPFGLMLHHHHIDVSDLMALMMAVRLVVTSIREGSESLWQRFMGSPFWRPMTLLLVLSILSLATALSHSTTAIKILEYIEFFVVIVAVARQADLREEAWKPVIAGLFAIASALALMGFYQFLFAVGPASTVVDHFHVRGAAVFGQPNAFGGFEAMVFPFVVALLAYGPDWSRRWWGWVATVLTALAVIESYSRGAWVASVAAVFFMGVVAWVARGRTMINRNFVVPAVVIPILAFVVIDLLGKVHVAPHFAHLAVGQHPHVKPHSPVKPPPHSHVKRPPHALPRYLRSKTTGKIAVSTVTSILHPKSNFDMRQRLKIYKEAYLALRHHPILGVGLGGFHRYSMLHPQPGLKSTPTAQNLYLEWGADLGVLGLVASIWIEWSWVKSAVGALTSKVRKLTPFEFAMGLGAFGAIVSFIVHDWVDFLIDHGVIVPFLLALAVVWVLAENRRSRRAP
ncbi:MAG: polymerase [Sulfobacillus acidophilus]|uniref:Polymerase n=1 Tax=Sulfobacillus acidophilus TaxID=53633 RepID=A0A2T2WLD1_9FIRM|nr:MAG: polymerase [Sulfobacillus acidophilus]